MFRSKATRWSAIAAAIALAFTLTSPVFAGDDLATLVPDNVLLFVGHAGQKACDKMSKGTAWGDLRDEPEIKRFEQAIFTVIDQAIQKGAEEEKLGPVYRDAKRLAKAFYNFPTALAIYSFEMEKAGPAPVVSGAIFCRCGADEADRMVKTVDQIFQRLDAPPPEIALVGASSLTKLPMPVGDGLFYGKLEDSFVLTVGEKAAKDLAARLGGKNEGSLADAKCVTLGRKHIGGGDETRATMAYVNVAGALGITRSMLPMMGGSDPEALATAEKVITGLGLDTLNGMLWENHYRDGGCVSGLFQFSPEGGKGLFAASGSKLTDDDLKRIPRDVTWASAFKFDLAGAYRSILAAVKEFPGAKENVDQGVAMVEGMIGFKLDEEFLALLDDTWVVYDSRNAGGLFFTGVTLSIKVKDGEQFASRVETLIRMAAAQAPRQTPMGELRIETRTIDHRKHKVTFINVGGLPMAISPAWTLDGDHLIFGLYPQMVTSSLDRLAAIKSDEDSILGHPDVVRAKKIIGQPESAWSYVDTRDSVETFYPIGLILLQMGTSMAQGQGIDVDVSAIPSLRTLTAHTFGEVRTTQQVEGGSLAMAFGPWPMAASPGFSLNAASIGMGASILMPAFSRSRELSKRTVCSANLRGIGQGLHIYANAHDGRFPVDLAVLINEDICTPKQFECLSRSIEMPESPTAEEVQQCYVYIGGQTTSSDPRNVVVYERTENHRGEGVNALFVDGHADFIRDTERFDRLLSETIERVKKYISNDPRVGCRKNLDKMSHALKSYARSHDGAFPPDLSTLIKSKALAPSDLCCPGTEINLEDGASEEELQRCYGYIPGLTMGDDSTLVVVYEKPGIHEEGAQMLMISGAMWYGAKDDYNEKMIQKSKDYVSERKR